MVKKEKGEWEKECESTKSVLLCKSRSPVSALTVTTDVAGDFEAKSIQFIKAVLLPINSKIVFPLGPTVF